MVLAEVWYQPDQEKIRILYADGTAEWNYTNGVPACLNINKNYLIAGTEFCKTCYAANGPNAAAFGQIPANLKELRQAMRKYDFECLSEPAILLEVIRG